MTKRMTLHRSHLSLSISTQKKEVIPDADNGAAASQCKLKDASRKGTFSSVLATAATQLAVLWLSHAVTAIFSGKRSMEPESLLNI